MSPRGRLYGGRPRLLDLFAGAGGAARGYQRAGFEVFGVDIQPQPRYAGDHFAQGDALDVLRWLVGEENDGDDVLGPELLELMRPDERGLRAVELVGGTVQHRSIEADHVGHREPPVGVAADSPKPATRVKGFDAIHASPPCQLFSVSTVMHDRSKHEDLLTPIRELLIATGLPYVIENVPGAPLRNPVMVCGSGLGMVRLRRHRLFESNVSMMGSPCAHGQNRDIISVVGHSEGNGRTGPGYLYADKCAAMGIDWMNRDELSQAIPPAYTELIGHQLMQHIRATPVLASAGKEGP